MHIGVGGPGLQTLLKLDALAIGSDEVLDGLLGLLVLGGAEEWVHGRQVALGRLLERRDGQSRQRVLEAEHVTLGQVFLVSLESRVSLFPCMVCARFPAVCSGDQAAPESIEAEGMLTGRDALFPFCGRHDERLRRVLLASCDTPSGAEFARVHAHATRGDRAHVRQAVCGERERTKGPRQHVSKQRKDWTSQEKGEMSCKKEAIKDQRGSGLRKAE